MKDRLTTLPDELLLQCMPSVADAPSALIQFGLVSHHSLQMTQELWKAACLQHARLRDLIHATVGEDAFKKGDVSARQWWLAFASKNRNEAMQAVFPPLQMISIYYASYESNPSARAHTALFRREREFYLTIESAKQMIPNIGSVKCFLRCALPVTEVNFSQISKGVVTSQQAIQQQIQDVTPLVGVRTTSPA